MQIVNGVWQALPVGGRAKLGAFHISNVQDALLNPVVKSHSRRVKVDEKVSAVKVVGNVMEDSNYRYVTGKLAGKNLRKPQVFFAKPDE